MCILCRKKQELLSKSGEWINHGMAAAGGDPSRRSEVSSPCMMSDKRPKLERAHSAVEKENVPLLQRSNSLLRRQYSQQEPSSRKEQEHGLTDEYYRTVRLTIHYYYYYFITYMLTLPVTARVFIYFFCGEENWRSGYRLDCCMIKFSLRKYAYMTYNILRC